MGPTLWNILYDEVLRVDLGEATKTIMYADELALLVRVEDREHLDYRVKLALNQTGRLDGLP